MKSRTDKLFDLKGKVAVLTGGGGVLAAGMAAELARRGAKVAVLDLFEKAAAKVADDIVTAGGEALAVKANVLERESVAAAAGKVIERWGQADILVNAAGGNRPEATTSETQEFFDLPPDALRAVTDLNLMGTVIPCQVFGRAMAGRQEGCIVNISSMSADRPLTRVVGYSAAKAAINNFTRWLAVYMARLYGPEIRVNAIAPGFFETQQNRYLLREEQTGNLTKRGQLIVDHTPMGRFGAPEDLLGTLVWLCSPSAAFVTGTVIPVDGGFSAFSGV